MSDAFHVDPSDGPHAAAGLTDNQVEYMAQLMLWELSIRYTEDQFMEYLEALRLVRQDNAEVIDQAKQDRDVINFEASVLADLDSLPSTEDRIVI